MALFLSVIIPCFRENEAQLSSCLDSLSFLNDLCEWEAWIVDDGSKENKVIDWVAKRNDNHLHAIRQENQGQSVARNTGLDNAKGEYIAFLDADDEFVGTEYYKLIQIAIKERPDAVGLRYKKSSTPYYDGNATEFMAQYDVVPSVCAYIIKRDALNGLRFTPGIYHEDEEFVTLLHLQIGRLIMTPSIAYRYNTTPDSTITSRNEEHLNKRFYDLLSVIERLQILHKESNSLSAHALDRRIHVLAMCFVVNLIRDGYSNLFIKNKLKKLKGLGLYPLPVYKGIHRYGYIRFFTRYPWCVQAIHKILRRS